jgi:hypothetical protein
VKIQRHCACSAAERMPQVQPDSIDACIYGPVCNASAAAAPCAPFLDACLAVCLLVPHMISCWYLAQGPLLVLHQDHLLVLHRDHLLVLHVGPRGVPDQAGAAVVTRKPGPHGQERPFIYPLHEVCSRRSGFRRRRRLWVNGTYRRREGRQSRDRKHQLKGSRVGSRAEEG